MRVGQMPASGSPRLMGLKGTGTWLDCHFRLSAAGVCWLALRRDDGSYDSIYQGQLATGRWHYIVLAARRASGPGATDGEARLYIDGVLASQLAGQATYDTFASTDVAMVGCWSSVSEMVWDFDEIKIAAGPSPYIEPAWIEPADEYPSAARTIAMLADTADGRAFADDLFAAGVDRGSVCYLPNASADETLADYATWQSQVEDDVLAWLEANPLRAAAATTLLLGPGLPGYFSAGGQVVSATSRLMNIRDAFNNPPAANPLFNPAAIERLRVSDLRAADLYLAARIDADSLANAQAILARGAGPIAIGANETAAVGEPALANSLALGRTRLEPASDWIGRDVAIAITGSPSEQMPTAGSRALYADTSAAPAATLRSPASPAAAAMLGGQFASAVASAAGNLQLDHAAMLEMLRIGGTFAEALAVASPTIDGPVVAAGCPWATLAMPRAGVNLYLGLGGSEAVDFSAPAAAAGTWAATLQLPVDLSDGLARVVVARNVSAAGVEETTDQAVAWLQADEAGNLLSTPLGRPADLELSRGPGGSYAMRCTVENQPGMAAPQTLEVFAGADGEDFDLDNPVASACFAPGSATQTIDLPAIIGPLQLAVRARSDQRTGPLSAPIRIPAAVAATIRQA
jgi:hypothetical protein